jgi:long-chain acyl-CoA synthetase
MDIPPTIAHLNHWRAQQSPDRIAYHAQRDGRYLPVTYREGLTLNTNLGMGLVALGVGKGDRVAIISQTRPEWTQFDSAILGMGGVVVGIYPTSTAEQTAYILTHSECRAAVVENKMQFDKVASLEPATLEHIIVLDHEGIPPGNWLTPDEVATQGKFLLAQKPGLSDELRNAIQPEEMATLIYTSGTTGPPKGVVMRHHNLVKVACDVADFLELRPDDVSLIYLPLAHSLQRVSAYIGTAVGITGYYLDDMLKLVETCKVVQPTALSAVPRIYEKIHTAVLTNLAKAPPRRQQTVRRALAVGDEFARRHRQNQSIPISLRFKHALYERLVYRKLRAALFGRRMRYLSSGAAPISPELLAFFDSIGLRIYEGYGLTETTSPITVNRPGAVKLGSVGRPLPGSQVKIAADGEILLKGPGVFTEYYKDPAATRAAFTEDGWFRSGDLGELDADGFLRITDRKKNLIVTAGGKNVAPANIENLLLAHPLISQAMVHGDKRNYLVALITLDPEVILAWANEQGKGGLAYGELTEEAEVVALVQNIVDKANQSLARYEQIKYFRILPEEASVENGLLTPTLKLKRRTVEDKYAARLDEMYRGVSSEQ